MKTMTLDEAWSTLDKVYPPINVYDAFVLKKDCTAVMNDLDYRAEAEANLLSLERSLGITELYEKLQTLYDKLTFLNISSPNSWRVQLPEEIEKEIKDKIKEVKTEIEITDTKLNSIRNSIMVEPEVLNLKT